MARKPNYGLNKHKKEQDRKAKKDAKMLDRQQRRDERSPAPDANLPGVPNTGADAPLKVPPNAE